MKIKELHFHRAATVNLGNYNSAKVEVGAIVELQDGDKEGEVFDKMTKWVNSLTSKQIREDVK